MGAIAQAVKHMLAAGMAAEAVVLAIAEMEEAGCPPRSARVDRNARYYESHRDELKERRLKASENGLKRLNGLKASDTLPSPQDPQPFLVTVEVNPTPPPSISSPSKAKTDWPKEPIDVWWPLYPRRVAKGDARKALEKAQRFGKITFASLCDATRRFAADPGCEPQFVPYPASWLNDERWADDKLVPPAPADPNATLPLPLDNPAYEPLRSRYRHEHGGADPPTNGKTAQFPAAWVQRLNVQPGAPRQ